MRSATGARIRSAVITAIACGFAGCTLENAIDVCQRKGHPEKDLNARTEGEQTLSTRNVAAAMPGGGAMVVWTSALDGASEARGALVTDDGTLLPTCEADTEFTYSPADHLADQVVLAAPRTSDELGAVVYRRTLSTGQSLWVVPITTSGCPMPVGLEPSAFELRHGEPGVALLTPSVTTLGDKTIVVTWTELAANSTKPHLLARRFLLERIGFAPQFMPTPLSPTGDTADAVELDAPLANGTLTPLADGAALAYFEVDTATYRIKLARVAPDLTQRWPPVLLEEMNVPSGLIPGAVDVTLAYEPDSFLVAWQAGDVKLAPVTLAMFVDGEGHYLSAPRSPHGGPFRLGSVAGSIEGGAVAVGTGDGGFLAAWQESGTLAHADTSGVGLRALGFDANGAVLFSNRACAATDFPLNLDFGGDQSQPALARLGDGTLLAIWTNKGGQTNDRSGTGLRVVGLSMRDLFPLR